MPIFIYCLYPTKNHHLLSTLVKCWSNVWKQLLVNKYFANIEQMLGATMMESNTEPFFYPTLAANSDQTTFLSPFQHWSNIGCIFFLFYFFFVVNTNLILVVEIGQMSGQYWEQIMEHKGWDNVWQMFGANKLVPNTQTILSQYWLPKPIQQYTFLGSQY